jgi:gluconokinase
VLVEVLDTLAAAHAADLPAVVGIGMSCFLHSVAGLDAGGRPLTPLLTWADTTSAEAAAGLSRRVDAVALRQATGAPLHASYWPARIVHLRALGGAPVRRFAGAPELLWGLLTGEAGIDLSLASGTGLLDRSSARWHVGLQAALDVDADALPEIVAPETSAPLAGWAAGRWPALAGVPCFAPWSDAWCGNLGVGAGAGGPAALQVGTSGALRVVDPDPVPTVPPGLFAHRLPDDTALVGGQLSEGGGVAAAVATLLGSTPGRLEAVALALPPDGHGLTILPFLAGERGPGYHARARGVVTGLSLATTPAELHLATLEAIALRFRALDERLTAHLGRPAQVVASGGALARSRLLLAVLAGAIGRPIRRSAQGEASIRGAALRTLTATGIIPSPASLAAPRSTIVEPEPARVAAYAPAAARQEALYGTILGEA